MKQGGAEDADSVSFRCNNGTADAAYSLSAAAVEASRCGSYRLCLPCGVLHATFRPTDYLSLSRTLTMKKNNANSSSGFWFLSAILPTGFDRLWIVYSTG